MNSIEERDTVDNIASMSMSDPFVRLLRTEARNRHQFDSVITILYGLGQRPNASLRDCENVVEQIEELYKSDRAVAMGLAFKQIADTKLSPDQQLLFADFFVEKAIAGNRGPGRKFMTAELKDPPESFQRLTTIMRRDKHLVADETFAARLSIAWNAAGDREIKQAIYDDIGMPEPVLQRRILGFAMEARGDKDFGPQVEAFLAKNGAPASADTAPAAVKPPTPMRASGAPA